MPVVADALLIQLGADFLFYNLCFLNEILLPEHGSPLEGSERFGNKEGCADRDLHLSVSLILGNLIIPLGDLLRQVSDTFHIIFCLLWEGPA